MRYKSPARSSFRDNKTYETLTTTRSTYSTSERGVDGPHCSDDSLISDKTSRSCSTVERHNRLNAETPPSKKKDKDQSIPLPPTPPHSHDPHREPLDHRGYPAGRGYPRPTYNITGDSPGMTVVWNEWSPFICQCIPMSHHFIVNNHKDWFQQWTIITSISHDLFCPLL